MNELRRIGACFTLASLLEVSVCPSPGLVSPVDNGSHTDMSMVTFMVGSSVLAPYFQRFAELGYELHHRALSVVFAKLREVGKTAEQELMKATSGVNTQRGQLFLLGLASGIAGVSLARGDLIPSPAYFAKVREACGGLSTRELSRVKLATAQTTGEKLYAQHGFLGIRGESEQGFPTVERIGYPTFAQGLANGLSINDAAVQALMSIMAELSDTTVLGRGGVEGLRFVHDHTQRALDLGGVYTAAGREAIRECHRRFCEARLSPGGAADLLALAMALFFIAHGYPTAQMIMTPSLFRM